MSIGLVGKSPVAVFDDAEQENAINGITAGIFGASGQSCIAGSRLYIQKGIYNEFLDKLSKRASKIKIGAPMDVETEMGPLSNFKQLETIERNIKDTIDQGGKIKCGGKRDSSIFLTKIAPDLSLSKVLVSVTVNKAIFTSII